MDALINRLMREQRHKVHITTLSEELNIEEEELKNEILSISEKQLIVGIKLDYLTGWVYFENNPRNPPSSKRNLRYSKTTVLLSIPLVVFFPPIGLLIGLAGMISWTKSIIHLKNQNDEDIDIVGAAAIMQKMTF